ncbi:hypothetical protein [Sphingomonas baiyangensis]|uniref:Inhibitor of vertebrate lysozyme (Ivy) n=1 Tax=Sphingomonas baiyangensis TaxID=2572576 RepID=A0A4U1L6N7_9SPHN|nr:hypothetical protein [Sphingomonas baiyangensis]TKD51955.1 hypothetical protein FBR43_15295 [Sphingomonas baiyangensis]
MRLPRATAAIGATLLLCACGGGAPDAANTAIAGNDAATANQAAATSSTSAALDVYRGRYPNEVVGATRFNEHPLVRAAVAKALGKHKAMSARTVLEGAGPATPIAMAGDRLLSWGCEQHNCGAHNWALLVAADGSRPELCYHNEAMQPVTRWLIDGEASARMLPEGCPSGDARPA